jgi:hypothetical protein
MNTTTPCEPDWLDRPFGMLAQAASLKSACIMLVALAVVAILRLLFEWQRRTTLVDLVERAPAGTVVVQEGGPGGPAMWVQVGHGSDQPQHEAS